MVSIWGRTALPCWAHVHVMSTLVPFHGWKSLLSSLPSAICDATLSYGERASATMPVRLYRNRGTGARSH